MCVLLIRAISQNIRLLFQAICNAHGILPDHCAFIFHQLPYTLIFAGKLKIWVICGRKDTKQELRLFTKYPFFAPKRKPSIKNTLFTYKHTSHLVTQGLSAF